jgi:hypothetical protein
MMFDPNQFLDQQFNEANDTKTIPVPAGEFIAVAEEAKVTSWQAKDDPSKAGLKLQVTWAVDDEGVKATVGRDKVTVRQEIMLDLTDAGMLDFGRGKNTRLGKLREALNLNTPGQPFAFSMIAGRPARITVGHTPNPKQPDEVYANVNAVARM